MVVRHDVKSLEEFNKLVSELDGKNIFALFCGSKTVGGKSWCPDCVRAQPVIEKILSSKMNADFHFIEVDVGDKATWRDDNNPFRKDKRIALTCVPTLLHWGGPQRLGDKDSSDLAKVEGVLSCS